MAEQDTTPQDEALEAEEEENQEHRPEEEQDNFELSISDDRMQLLLRCPAPPQHPTAFLDLIINQLEHRSFQDPKALAEVSRRIQKALHENEDLSNFSLLEGKPPVPPVDGSVKWGGDFFKRGFVQKEEGDAVDYRRQAGDRSVMEGQLLATVYPPQEGKEGVDIFGKVIAPRQARPYLLKTGNNIRFDEESSEYFATKDGRIRIVGDSLSVDDVYTISGSVDLKTGHIDHPGSLVINQNIDSGAIVRAKGDIEVHGAIEDAQVYAGGNLTVGGGITGGANCVIRVDGELHAHFAENADIEVLGDVIVDREIDQCTIRTQGALVVESGRIVGGQLTVLKGVTTADLGSEVGIRTKIIAGLDFKLKAELESREKLLEDRKATLEKISQKLAPFKAKGKNLPPKMREAVTILLEQLQTIRSSMESLEREMEQLRNDSKAAAKKEIRVSKTLYPDTWIKLPPMTMLTKQEYQGPVKVSYIDRDIRILKAKIH